MTGTDPSTDVEELPPVADPVPVSGQDTAPDCPACARAMTRGSTELDGSDGRVGGGVAWFCDCTGDGDGAGPGGGG